MISQGDTIFALASARGVSGVAVFRISGPSAHNAAMSLCGSLPPPRRAGLRKLAADGEAIDQALVLVFEAGASFTGEPSVELHVHGSAAVIRRLEAVLEEVAGCRHAKPGEFTRRALENGRLDLTQVEGLADLLAAETEAQLRQAQKALFGDLGRKVEEWRNLLVRASALVEAAIDFADEDVPEDVTPEVRDTLSRLAEEWRHEIAGIGAAERIRDGFEVAIVGAPNAGKSTLINILAKRDVALISDRPGTTRDVLEVRMNLGGLAVTFLDTAGIRDSADVIEAAGIARAKARASGADLRLFLDGVADTYGLYVEKGDLLLHGKCDLSRGSGLNVSGKTGEGLDELLALVRSELEDRVAGSGLATRDRHERALAAATGHVSAALGRLGRAEVELVADDLRAARQELDVLVGRVDVEDILGHIFSSFCIGK